MVCEDLQTDVVSHDDFSRHAALVVVGGGRVQLCQQEPGLTTILVTVDKVRDGESLLDDRVCFSQRLLQQYKTHSFFAHVLQHRLQPPVTSQTWM